MFLLVLVFLVFRWIITYLRVKETKTLLRPQTISHSFLIITYLRVKETKTSNVLSHVLTNI